jgi:pimeloyl-ACP methyl ester carboxylesterase
MQVRSQKQTPVVETDVAKMPVGSGFPTPRVSYHHMQLPKTNLHFIMCGDGPPLIMVPATISKIENWLALAQFMGQRFTVYFFELPGHGKSTPFPEAFSSELAAETMEAFIDGLGYKTVSLMGFSFGGILALTALKRLRQRIEKVLLLSPVVSSRALRLSGPRRQLLKGIVRMLGNPRLRSEVLRFMRNPKLNRFVAHALAQTGRVEPSMSVGEVFLNISNSTADVLRYQLAEMLDFEIDAQAAPFGQECYFAMSERDPMLSFDTTLEVLKRNFPTVHVEKFQFPYHQPPKPITFEEMNQNYSRLLNIVCSNENGM